MKQLQARDIEERLQRELHEVEVPEPPRGLLKAIQTEIPDDIAPRDATGGAGRRGGFRLDRRWLAAASVVVALGAGLLGLRVAREGRQPVSDSAATKPVSVGQAGPAAALPMDAPARDAAPLDRVDSDLTDSTLSSDAAAEQKEELSKLDSLREARQQEPAAQDEAAESSVFFAVPEAVPDAEPMPALRVPDSVMYMPPPPAARKVPIPDPTPLEPATSRDNTNDERFRQQPRARRAAPAPSSTSAPPPSSPKLSQPSVDSAPEFGVNYRIDASGKEVEELERQAAALEAELKQLGNVNSESPLIDERLAEGQNAPGGQAAPPSTGGTAEPNDAPYGDEFDRDYGVNPFIDTDEDALSTFALDVDTGSYTRVRGYLEGGHLPPPAAVRVEEMVNFFDYRDPAPRAGQPPLAVAVEGAATPFAHSAAYRLLRVSVRGRELDTSQRPPAMLIFTVDVSGSMDRGDRLGLVKQALGLLLGQLRADDRVGLVIYGSRGQVVLEPTSDHAAIRQAIDGLRSEGSTNAEEGLTLAYQLAERHLRPGAINRVILCSDGVANVGASGPESILARIGSAARQGIELTTVGFGMGNYNDVLMEQLADRGNGQYAYVDRLAQARRIFVDDLTGTLTTLAFDAKIQVELDPRAVSRYRLLGYENRDVADERFRDDSVDAGEIGAGHAVTALYEIKLTPAALAAAEGGAPMHLATARLRYRPVGKDQAVEQEVTIDTQQLAASWRKAPASLRLAAIVAELAEVLRGSYWAKGADLELLLREAQAVSVERRGDADTAELIGLIGKAVRLLREKSQGD
jgi:Ca-activated chloride channel family protein